uniref:hypothetical protein n=1 Tax=Pseudofabraea citricarpa TaxID=1664388 RepID=UPI0022FD496B|nr:hypothetical protein PN052_mgp24 [Pseudofabraea citricarpa]WAX38803.1 hypothetical protein [Pseudofabraea citricarpa]
MMASMTQSGEYDSKWRVWLKVTSMTQSGEYDSKWRVWLKVASRAYGSWKTRCFIFRLKKKKGFAAVPFPVRKNKFIVMHTIVYKPKGDLNQLPSPPCLKD